MNNAFKLFFDIFLSIVSAHSDGIHHAAPLVAMPADNLSKTISLDISPYAQGDHLSPPRKYVLFYWLFAFLPAVS